MLVQRSTLVRHNAKDMYDLVNDVAAYPQYMEGCEGAEILERGDDYMVARLDLRKAGIGYSFTTRNSLNPPHEIRLDLHAGPFKRLHGAWTFKHLTDGACKVSFHLEFESNSKLLAAAANHLLSSVANNLVSAVSQQADKVYGSTIEP